MIKNPNSKPGYCEEYDGEALDEIAEMAKLYVARENGFDSDGCGSGIPNGNFSDFSCGVWEKFTDAVRYGMWLERKKRERENIKFRVDYLNRKMEESKNFNNSWKKPILEES